MTKVAEPGKENESQMLLKKLMDFVPPSEQQELMEKVDRLSSKKKAPANMPEIKVKKKKSQKNENIAHTVDKPKDNNDNKSENLSSNQDAVPPTGDELSTDLSKNNNTKIQTRRQKMESSPISLIEETEENEEENVKVEKTKTKNTKASKKFCGQKRNNPEKEKVVQSKETISEKKSQKVNADPVQIKTIKEDAPKKKRITESPEEKYWKKDSAQKTEREKLYEIVKKEGFFNVLSCLNNTSFNRKNPLEKEVDDIIGSIGLLRTSLILFEIKFSEDKFNNIGNKPEEKENNHTGRIRSNRSGKVPIKDKNLEVVIDGNEEEATSPKHKSIKKSESTKNMKAKNAKENKNKIDSVSPKENSGNVNDDVVNAEVGAHLQKDKEGKIYKFSKHHLRLNKGKNIYVFYCADPKCKAKSCYHENSMMFENIRGHGLKYNEHCYIKNKDRSDKYRPIIEEFEQRDCHEAQIFKKKNGNQIVKWYD